MEIPAKVFFEYELRADLLCIGERTKKGTFKPCVKTIPYSTITYALQTALGRNDIHAVGMLDEKFLRDIDRFRGIQTYSPRSRYEDVSKVPLNIEYLIDVVGRVYLLSEEGTAPETSFEITMGAFRSKGFGRCVLEPKQRIKDPSIKKGVLLTRLPVKRFDLFGIARVEKPIYGYLFEPSDISTGTYFKSIIEGSVITAYDFLLKKEE